MNNHHGFNWLSFLPGFYEYGHVYGAVLVSVLLILFTWIASFRLNRAFQSKEGALIPESKLSIKNIFEIIAESLFSLTEGTIGSQDAPKYFPVVGALFLFIFASNALGLIPGFLPPTDNINTTLALGIFVFFYYNYVGLKEHGVSYLKHFLGPIIWLAPLMLVIELASHIFRPLSLALRLRGNIMGDHVVLGVFSDLVPYLLPVIFYGLGVFVAFIQAFVFCLMTMVYISLSTSHDH